MTSQSRKPGFSRRYLLVIALFALTIYIIVPQLGDFKDSWHLLKSPDYGWAALALLLTGLTYFAAAATYCLLAFSPLGYFRTVLVELAVMFVNRLLPGGVGALGGNYLYLTKHGHTPAQAGIMVAINNALGFVGHNLLLLSVVVVGGASAIVSQENSSNLGWLKYLALGLIALALLAITIWRRRLVNILKDLRDQLFSYRRRLHRLVMALGSSVILTTANILSLYACTQALGIDLGIAQIFIIFSVGLGAGTATPTPGGLGGFEAGLVAALIAYGVDSAPALAAALLYRLISYWLPLAVGAAAFITAQRRQLL